MPVEVRFIAAFRYSAILKNSPSFVPTKVQFTSFDQFNPLNLNLTVPFSGRLKVMLFIAAYPAASLSLPVEVEYLLLSV